MDGTAHTGSMVYASLFQAVSSDDGFSVVVAACGAVLGFVELHCDVPVFPGEDGAQSRSSWVRRARRVATAGDQADGSRVL